MANKSKMVTVRPWVFIVLGGSIALLVGLCGYLFGRVASLNDWVEALTAAQQTSVAPAVPAQTAEAGTLTLDTIRGIFDYDVVKYGDGSRPLLVVEVTDPSCPYCQVAGGHNPELAAQIDARFTYASEGGSYQPPVPEIRKLVEEGKASYAFVYFPGHANGEMAAKALYCAFEQGKFWEVHDLLYSMEGYYLINNTVKNDSSQSGVLADFLKSAVDAQALRQCLDSGKYDGRPASEAALAAASLLDPQQGGTPTFILNTTRFSGAYSWTDMQATARAALD